MEETSTAKVVPTYTEPPKYVEEIVGGSFTGVMLIEIVPDFKLWLYPSLAITPNVVYTPTFAAELQLIDTVPQPKCRNAL